jgi:hypothetical protein
LSVAEQSVIPGHYCRQKYGDGAPRFLLNVGTDFAAESFVPGAI